MNRYSKMFQRLKKEKEGCLVPFLTIGDPSIKLFLKIVDVLIQQGVNALELGIPFSDPLADGLIIQNSHLRALSNKININVCFKILKKIREKYPSLPIGILVYANIIFNKKIPLFLKLCKENGVDSILIPDIPIEESKIFYDSAISNKINYILICPPNANNRLLKKISKKGTGYIYLLSRLGITGLKNNINPNKNTINKLKQYTSIPILQGFGISKINHVKSSLLSGTNGVIFGSVIIKIIEKYNKDNNIMLKKIENLIKNFKKCNKIHDN